MLNQQELNHSCKHLILLKEIIAVTTICTELNKFDPIKW